MIPLLILIGLGGLAYATLIEPFWIEVTRHRVKAPVSCPLKIAHLTDIQTVSFGRRERAFLALLEAEKPDAIVVTGDTKDKRGTYAMCREVLRRLRAPLGVWLVRGNWENWAPLAAEEEEPFYRSAGVNLLLNANHRLTETVWLVGLNDATSGTPDLDAALAGVPPDAFKILLQHSPFYFDQLSATERGGSASGGDGQTDPARRVDLILAGHTHGGQIRFPFLGAIWFPPGCGRFSDGWFGKDGSRMYVSRGIGTSLATIRFLCRPELAIITLEPC